MEVMWVKRLWNKFIQKIAKDVKKELVKDLERVGYKN